MLCSAFVNIAGQIPVKQVLVRAYEKRAGSTGRVEDGDAFDLFAVLAFELVTDGIPHNVLHDIGRRVVHAACLFDFWFVFHHGTVAGSEADDLAKELLVHAAKDVCTEH